ncbi:MAG: choice-of-anchor T family protein, partial [Thermoplasmatota archaeon]
GARREKSEQLVAALMTDLPLDEKKDVIVATLSGQTNTALNLLNNGADVNAAGDATVVINLHQSKQTAYVAPGQDGIVTFTGTVTAQVAWSPNIQYLYVDIEAYAGGWPVSTPPRLTFSRAQKEQSFTVSVQAPNGASSDDPHGLFVNGTWSYSPGVMSGECEGATAIIVVAQYYALDIGADDPIVQCERPGEAELTIFIENIGNGNDEAGLDVTNFDELLDQGIEAMLPDNRFVIEEGEIREILLYLKSSDKPRQGTYEIELEAHSFTAVQRGYPQEKAYFTAYIEVVREIEEQEEPEEPEEPQEPEEPEEPEQPEEPEEPEVPEEPISGDDDDDDDIDVVEEDIGSGEKGFFESSWAPALALLMTLIIAGAVGVYFILIRRGRK